MEAYTLNRNFDRTHVVDAFNSLIWTERFYGDSDCVLVVPATKTNIEKYATGTLFELEGSQEPMILETHNIDKEGKLTVTGISILRWLNNRFIRTTAAHADRYWNSSGLTAGETVWNVINQMCVISGPSGIPNPERFIIPQLGLLSMTFAGDPITVAIPYGPVYDAIYEIATTYQVGMTIILERNYSYSPTYQLLFRSYKGEDRTALQSTNPVVRFSPDMDSLTDIEELTSIAAYKTHAFAFVPTNPGGLASAPGTAKISDDPTGFDFRAIMVFAEDITTDLVGGSAATMQSLLDQRAARALADNPYLVHVDGEIVPTSQFKYGQNYGLGDIIEIAGHSGVVQHARITEYIRSHDESGEKAYPTVTMI